MLAIGSNHADTLPGMNSRSRPFWQIRLRRRIALTMAVAILFAGIAQAAHYHKDDLAGGNTDVQCLLCLFAASGAGPPPVVQLVQGSAPGYCSDPFPASIPCPQDNDAASYDARGPPPA